MGFSKLLKTLLVAILCMTSTLTVGVKAEGIESIYKDNVVLFSNNINIDVYNGNPILDYDENNVPIFIWHPNCSDLPDNQLEALRQEANNNFNYIQVRYKQSEQGKDPCILDAQNGIDEFVARDGARFKALKKVDDGQINYFILPDIGGGNQEYADYDFPCNPDDIANAYLKIGEEIYNFTNIRSDDHVKIFEIENKGNINLNCQDGDAFYLVKEDRTEYPYDFFLGPQFVGGNSYLGIAFIDETNEIFYVYLIDSSMYHSILDTNAQNVYSFFDGVGYNWFFQMNPKVFFSDNRNFDATFNLNVNENEYVKINGIKVEGNQYTVTVTDQVRELEIEKYNSNNELIDTQRHFVYIEPDSSLIFEDSLLDYINIPNDNAGFGFGNIKYDSDGDIELLEINISIDNYDEFANNFLYHFKITKNDIVDLILDEGTEIYSHQNNVDDEHNLLYTSLVLKNGNKTEKIVVNFFPMNNGPEGGSFEYTINGNRYYIRTIVFGDESNHKTYEFILPCDQPISDMTIGQIAGSVPENVTRVLVDYSNKYADPNVVMSDYFIHGALLNTETDKAITILDAGGIEFSTDSNVDVPSDKIVTLSSPVSLEVPYRRDVDEQYANDIIEHEFIENPIYYLDANDNKVAVNYVRDLSNYSGPLPVVSAYTKAGENGFVDVYYTIKTQDNTRFYKSMLEYAPEEEFNDFAGSPVHIVKNSDDTNEILTNKLENEINNLAMSKNAKIVLDTDITLTRDIYLKHHANVLNNENIELSTGVEIDLNGHTINTGNNTIHLCWNSVFNIVNNSTISSAISGNNVTIDNFSKLIIKNNVTIKSTDNTAIKNNNIGFICLGEGAKVNGKTGIEYHFTGALRYGSMSSMIYVTGGSEISGSEYGVKIDEIGTRDNNICTMYLRTFKDQRQANPKITSVNGTAIYVGRSTQLELRDVEIEAAHPIEIKEGKLQLSYSTVTSTASNSPAILFSSNSYSQQEPAAHSVYGEITKCKISSNGSLAKTTEGNKLEKLNILAVDLGCDGGSCELFDRRDSYYVFDYVGNAFEIPNGQLNVAGGTYCNNDVSAKLNSSNLSLGQVTINNKTYYVLTLNNAYAHVTTYNELANALRDPFVQSVQVDADITTSINNNTAIDVYADDALKNKVLKLNGHNLTNVCLNLKKNELTITNYDNNNDLATGAVYGKMTNNTQKPLITIDGSSRTTIRYVTLDSKNSDAILIKDLKNSLFVENKAKISGSRGIVIDKNNNNQISVEIDSSEIYGVNGAAIHVVRTNENKNFGDSFINMRNNSKAIVSNGSAIKVDDYMRFFLYRSEVRGYDYGFDMNAGAAFIRDKSIISALDKAAIRANNDNQNNLKSIEILASYSTMTGKNSIIESHGDTLINVESGYFYSPSENAKFLTMDGTSPNYHDNSIKSGFFSMFVSDKEIGDRYDVSTYKYFCYQLDALTAKYPYVVMFKRLDKEINNFTNINTVTDSINVSVDESQLDKAILNSEREVLEQEDDVDVDVVLTVTDEIDSANINKFISGNDHTEFLEYLDIHMNKNVGNNKQKVDEVAEFQIITIELSNLKKIHSDGSLRDIVQKMPGNVVIHHRHGDAVTILKKVSEEDGRKLQEECYFVTQGDNGKFFINIVTRRFSTFALGINPDDIEVQNLKDNVSLTLNYQDSYFVTDSVVEPSAATYGNNMSILKARVNVIYEGTGDTVYYSNTAPTAAGTYKVTWTIKDTDDSLSGFGSKEFSIIECTHVFDEEIVDADHLASAATCTDKATYYYSCSKCHQKGTTTFENGEALGHSFAYSYSYDENNHWYAATCVHSTEKKDLAAHTFDEGAIKVEATHLSEGSKTLTCSACSKTKNVPIPKTEEHTFNERVTSAKYLAKAATCEEKAEYYYSCLCGEKGTSTFEYGEVLGHTKNAVNGKIEGNVIIKQHDECSVCHKLFKDDQEISLDDLKTTVETVLNDLDEIANSSENHRDQINEIVEDLGQNVFTKVIANEIKENNSAVIDIIDEIENKVDDGFIDNNVGEKVVIEAVGYSLNSDDKTVLVIDEVENKTKEKELLAGKDINENRYISFSISLFEQSDTERENHITELDIPIVVTVKIPDNMNKDLLVLYHNHNGSYNHVSFKVIEIDGENYIRFTVSGLSDFVLAEKVVSSKGTENPSPAPYIPPRTDID